MLKVNYKSLNQSQEFDEFDDGEHSLLLKELNQNNAKLPPQMSPLTASKGTGVLRSRGNPTAPSSETPAASFLDDPPDEHRSSSAESKSRRSSPSDPNFVYIERKISKNDSLTNLALQYETTVAELKRVNGLLSDQEFYGRGFVRIPVKRHSALLKNLMDAKKNDQILVDLSLTQNSAQIEAQEPGPSNRLSAEIFASTSFDASVGFDGSTVFDGLSDPRKTASLQQTSRSAVDQSESPTALESSDGFLRAVDENLLKAKEHVQRKNGDDQPAPGPSENQSLQDVDLYEAAARRLRARRFWWQRNVTHFVVVVLLIFLVLLVPLFVLLYNVIMAVEGEGPSEVT